LSWQAAMREAQLVVDRLQLKNSEINGQKLDLQEIMASHPSTGRFRVMIMQAVHRLLESRGARSNIAKMEVKRRRAPGEK
jgi:hypothetical protein